MLPRFFWCVKVENPDKSFSIYYFEANYLQQFPNIDGRFVEVKLISM